MEARGWGKKTEAELNHPYHLGLPAKELAGTGGVAQHDRDRDRRGLWSPPAAAWFPAIPMGAIAESPCWWRSTSWTCKSTFLVLW